MRERLKGMRGRIAGRIGAIRGPAPAPAPRWVLVAFWLILAVGAALRLYLMYVRRPALLGFPDSSVYLTEATGNVFWDPLRAVGYGMFLHVLREVFPNLTAATLVQHGMGLGAGVLIYGAVRRLGGPAALGLVPLAVMALGGEQLLLEHAILSESVFLFLLAVVIWLLVRGLDGESPGWQVGAGMAAGALGCVRLAGLAAVPVVILWLLFQRPGEGLLRRLVPPVAAAAGCAVVVGAYLIAHENSTGQLAFSRASAYNLYGRVGPFADCKKFDPPAGTRVLCEKLPPARRLSASFYVFGTTSPAGRAFHGATGQYPPPPADMDKIRRFSRAAVLGQPLDYADAVLKDVVRYVDPDANSGQSGETPTAIVDSLFDPKWDATAISIAGRRYHNRGVITHSGLGTLHDYGRDTELQGPVLGLLLLVALFGPLVGRGRARRGWALTAGLSAALLLAPVLTLFYTGRYAVPVYGPLAASAAIGGWGVWLRLRALVGSGQRSRAGGIASGAP